MGQEFFINSQELEDKIRQLLPSQGGAGAGFDLSASTQIIPVIDLTESAEGSNVRQDLQTALSFSTATSFAVTSASTTIINNTGWFRIIGGYSFLGGSSLTGFSGFALTDGSTTKNVFGFEGEAADTTFGTNSYDFIVKLEAGESCVCISNNTNTNLNGSTRQIADLDGNLVNP
jgi:hypothetical protein